jgi:hypothetical protein
MTQDKQHIDVSKLPILENDILKIKIHNFEEIKAETLKLMDQETPLPWNTHESNYYGIGLTYNPNYELQVKTQQVLGKINDNVGRDTYEDSWAFSVPLRASVKLF